MTTYTCPQAGGGGYDASAGYGRNNPSFGGFDGSAGYAGRNPFFGGAGAADSDTESFGDDGCQDENILFGVWEAVNHALELKDWQTVVEVDAQKTLGKVMTT